MTKYRCPAGAVLVDEWVADQIRKDGLEIVHENSDKHPCVVWPAGSGRTTKFLHKYVDDLAVKKNKRPPMQKGHIIHHRNEKKRDNRLKNLVRLPDREHRKLHARERRTRKPSYNVSGFWRPHQPGPVRTIDPQTYLATRATAPDAARAPDEQHQLPLGEKISITLESWVPAMRQYIGAFDSTTAIPVSKGLRTAGVRERMECTRAELGFLGLLIWVKLDRARAAAMLAEALSEEESLVAEHLRPISQRTAVAVALERWLKYRRLPRPLSWRWRAVHELPLPPVGWVPVGCGSWWRWTG